MSSKVGAFALLLAGLIGCSRAPSPVTNASPAQPPLTFAAVVGEYTLFAVDGKALPFVPSRDGKVDVSARPVVSGSLTLNANGTFRLQTAFGLTDATSSSASGACYAEGDQVKMVWDGGGLTRLTLRGDTLLLAREGALFAYLPKR